MSVPTWTRTTWPCVSGRSGPSPGTTATPAQPARLQGQTWPMGWSRPRPEAMASGREPCHSDRMGMIETHTKMGELRDTARAEVSKIVVGQDQAVELLLIAAIAHGHVLVEGPPGGAKTLLANAVARVLGVNFKRVQFTPDTTANEILGYMGRYMGEPVFEPGAVFTNVLLADEINRTPPKSQAALLEAMQERVVTIEGNRYPLPDPFLVIATQNPFEQSGVFPLAESQL